MMTVLAPGAIGTVTELLPESCACKASTAWLGSLLVTVTGTGIPDIAEMLMATVVSRFCPTAGLPTESAPKNAMEFVRV